MPPRPFMSLSLSIALLCLSSDAGARGFGGGGRGMARGGGMAGGGFRGGAPIGAGGYGGIAGPRPGAANFNPGPRAGTLAPYAGAMNRSGTLAGTGVRRGASGFRSASQGAATRPGRAQGLTGERFATPSRNELSSFLGLPSDEGLHGVTAAARTGASQLPAGGANFDVNYGRTEGPRGGQVGGVTITAPGGNTVGRAVGVGPQGGVGTIGGVQGAGGVTAGRGVAVGPGGQVAAVGGIRGPEGGAAMRGVTTGPMGTAAGFARVSPSGRYVAGAAVRTNYAHWGVYGRGWYVQYPGAWLATAWAAGAAWNASTWGDASAYCGYSDEPPVYYDYGNNVSYEDGNVYVNGDNAGTAEQYYDQAAKIAATGAEADAPADGDWLPLGVFAFSRPDQQKSDISIQLAVNRQGVIRGNYTDSATNQNQVIQGSVDKQTQRVAFTVGDNKKDVIETGLYNLTKEEAPCLLHVGTERTEQWLLVRLKKPDDVPQN